MSQALSPRWETPFGRWVHDTGVSRIVAALGRDPDLSVTNHAVYDWVAGRHPPKPAHAMALVRMSHGRLTLEEIYQHRHQVRGLGVASKPTEGMQR